MFNPSRDEARRFLIDAWGKHRAGSSRCRRWSGIAAGSDRAASGISRDCSSIRSGIVERDYSPEAGDINPFLHLSLHLAVAEQLAIDQPPGIRAQFERLRAARGDEHAALHAVLECLGRGDLERAADARAARRGALSRLPGAAG